MIISSDEKLLCSWLTIFLLWKTRNDINKSRLCHCLWQVLTDIHVVELLVKIL